MFRALSAYCFNCLSKSLLAGFFTQNLHYAAQVRGVGSAGDCQTNNLADIADMTFKLIWIFQEVHTNNIKCSGKFIFKLPAARYLLKTIFFRPDVLFMYLYTVQDTYQVLS